MSHFDELSTIRLILLIFRIRYFKLKFYWKNILTVYYITATNYMTLLNLSSLSRTFHVSINFQSSDRDNFSAESTIDSIGSEHFGNAIYIFCANSTERQSWSLCSVNLIRFWIKALVMNSTHGDCNGSLSIVSRCWFPLVKQLLNTKSDNAWRATRRC